MKLTKEELSTLNHILRERERLKQLTSADLVAECANTDAADYLLVKEMMYRLDPHWDHERNPVGGQ